MRYFSAAVLAVFLMLPLAVAGAEPLPQSPLTLPAAPGNKYPKIVLFSTSWCPHCKAAKEYFTSKNIPFINRDVELDGDALELLTGKYKSQGVPVIVIGEDAEVIKGFDQGRFEKALERHKGKDR